MIEPPRVSTVPLRDCSVRSGFVTLRHMNGWSRKIVLLLALLALPLNGIAATLAAPPCHAEHQANAVAHHDGSGTLQQHDSNASNAFSGHFYCQNIVSGMPVAAPSTVIPDYPSFQGSIFVLSSLFVPEQPQRPPLA